VKFSEFSLLSLIQILSVGLTNPTVDIRSASFTCRIPPSTQRVDGGSQEMVRDSGGRGADKMFKPEPQPILPTLRQVDCVKSTSLLSGAVRRNFTGNGYVKGTTTNP